MTKLLYALNLACLTQDHGSEEPSQHWMHYSSELEYETSILIFALKLLSKEKLFFF